MHRANAPTVVHVVEPHLDVEPVAERRRDEGHVERIEVQVAIEALPRADGARGDAEELPDGDLDQEKGVRATVGHVHAPTGLSDRPWRRSPFTPLARRSLDPMHRRARSS